MEEKKNVNTKVVKKKSTFWRRTKRTFKKLIRGIVKFFIMLKDKFMSLPKKLRYIICVWVIVLVVLFIMIVGSKKTADNLVSYHEMENMLSEATLSYVTKQELYPNVGKKLRVDMNLLIDENYLSEAYVTDKTCIGYSIVYYNEEKGEYKIDPYINCKHYTTKNFAEDFEQ